MVLADLYCDNCGHEVIDVFVETSKKEHGACEICEIGILRKKIGCAGFELKYDNRKDMCGWACDGYSSSQYWKNIKKDKEEGKKSFEQPNERQPKWV